MVGVGAILLDDAGASVLLVQRGAPPAVGQWTFPGGLAEAGESLRQATAREVREETGLQVELGQVAKLAERVVRDDQGRVEYHYVIVDFAGRVTGGELCAASDVRDARWVPLDQVNQLPVTRGVAEAARRAAALVGGDAPETPMLDD